MTYKNKTMDNFKESLKYYKKTIEEYLLTILPKSNDKTAQAMCYAVSNGGKRIRPALVYIIGEMFGTAIEKLNPAAASIELIHCYSLVHDDLPAMDDDDFRRGKPSCHKQFDEATAILAGDALQTLAFEVLSEPNLNPVDDSAKTKMVSCLAKASGSNGMVLGQTLDMESESKFICLDSLKELHKNKTGQLIKASINLGIIASDKIDTIAKQLLNKFADSIGLLFQIQDDILDVVGDSKTLGKPQGSDIENNKSTFVSLMGLEEAKVAAQNELNKALDCLKELREAGLEVTKLKNIANYFYYREM